MLKLLFGIATVGLVALPITAEEKKEPIKVKLADFKQNDKLKNDVNTHDEGAGKLCFYAPAIWEAKVAVSIDGEYEVIIKASCDAAKGERAKFKLHLDGKVEGKEVTLTDDGEKEYKLKVKLKKGTTKLGIEFTNDEYKENEYDRNLYVHDVKSKAS